jgi:hypothetical protein
VVLNGAPGLSWTTFLGTLAMVWFGTISDASLTVTG